MGRKQFALCSAVAACVLVGGVTVASAGPEGSAKPPPPKKGKRSTAPVKSLAPPLPKCTMRGTAGPDFLHSKRKVDVICGLGGADHIWGNPFDDPATITVAIRPALNLETFFETVFGLASDGKLDPKTQMPSFLQMVLLLHEYRNDVTLPGVAGVATRGLGLVLAPLARARGYRGRYPQYSDPDSP